MKYILPKKRSNAIIVLLFLFAVSPAITMAQTNSQLYQDGSSTPVDTRQQQIRQYRQQSSELQEKISALGNTASASIYMPVLLGVYVKDISPNFGDARSGGRTHEGEDIMAPKGTPIVSPTPAVVLRTGSGGTEGIYVYTANPGGETFVYYHLDRIGEGVVPGLVLAQGSLIGYVGDTGNASGGASHLHFEIHNNLGVPTDPFLRLVGDFSLQEKISYLSVILTQSSNSVALAQQMATNFKSTFTLATLANITLPASISNALLLLPPTPNAPNTPPVIPAGDLDVGSMGIAVTNLQKYLILANSGVNSTYLARASATGYFGLITKSALVEFQIKMGIIPLNGYYGATTRDFIVSHPLAPQVPSTTPTTLTRDLYLNINGEDVRTLQKLLNANGYVVSLAGGGSVGNETTYFGQLTKIAVIKFQTAKNISPIAGYVGLLTRTALLAL